MHGGECIDIGAGEGVAEFGGGQKMVGVIKLTRKFNSNEQ
jgi:hypothetical protein